MSAIKSKTTRAARTPAQQAVIDQMRAGMSAEQATAKVMQAAAPAAPAAAPAAPANAQPNFVVVANSAPIESDDDLNAQAQAYFAELLASMELTKRKALAFILSVACSAGGGYLLGNVAGYAIAGIATLGGSMFWAFMIAILAIVTSYYMGGYIARNVFSYVADARIDKDYEAVKSTLINWYDSAKSLVVSTPTTPSAI